MPDQNHIKYIEQFIEASKLLSSAQKEQWLHALELANEEELKVIGATVLKEHRLLNNKEVEFTEKETDFANREIAEMNQHLSELFEIIERQHKTENQEQENTSAQNDEQREEELLKQLQEV